MSQLTIKDLQLIESVSATGTLVGASKRLHVTPSAISQRLSNLQHRLDVELLVRGPGGLVLTAAGERILSAADVVQSELSAALDDISRLASQSDQQLRIATQCYTCYRWLPAVIKSMHAAFPSLSIDVVPEATDAPYEAIRSGLIDVAVVSNLEAAGNLQSLPLFGDELFAVMHEDHPLAKRKYLTPANFVGQTLLLYTGKKHAIVEEVLRPAEVSDYSLVQVRITEAIVELARAGRGIAVIAGWAFDDFPDTSGLVPVRITRKGFLRTWQAVTADPDCHYLPKFVSEVQRVGNVMKKHAWRSRLDGSI